MADNFHFDLTGVPLRKSLEIATLEHKAIGWKEQVRTRGEAWGVQLPSPQGLFPARSRSKPIDVRIMLYWTDKDVKDLNRFPAVMGVDQLETVIKAWLDALMYGPEPDHDGSNSKGWHVYNERYGRVNDEWQTFAAIEPVWLEYGK